MDGQKKMDFAKNNEAIIKSTAAHIYYCCVDALWFRSVVSIILSKQQAKSIYIVPAMTPFGAEVKIITNVRKFQQYIDIVLRIIKHFLFILGLEVNFEATALIPNIYTHNGCGLCLRNRN